MVSEPSNYTQLHRTPVQPFPTIHNLSVLRNHKRITIPQIELLSNTTTADSTVYTDHKCTTKRVKGTMEALSYRELRKIYGHVSVSIMKRRGCCGVALRDSSSRTPIEIVNHDNTSIGFEQAPDAVQRQRKRHKHRPWAECDFTSKSISFVPAQSTTTTAPSTIPRRCPSVTTPTHSSWDTHTSGYASEHENARHA